MTNYIQLTGGAQVTINGLNWVIRDDYSGIIGRFSSEVKIEKAEFGVDLAINFNGIKHIVRIKSIEVDTVLGFGYVVEKRVDKTILELSSRVVGSEQGREALIQLIKLISNEQCAKVRDDIVRKMK